MTREMVRLGDVLELERIPAAIDSDSKYTQIGVRSFGRGIFHRDPCGADDLSKIRYFQVHPDRLVVSNIMAWEGAIALSGEAENGCIGSSRFLSYKAVGEIDLTYLNYYFQSTAGRDAVRSASTGTVTRNQTLSIRDFEDLRLPLPQIAEQHLFASQLDKVAECSRKITSLRGNAKVLQQQHLDSVLSSIENSAKLSDALTLSSEIVTVEQARQYRIAGMYSFGRGLIDRGIIFGSETSYRSFSPLHRGQLVMSKLNAWEGALAIVPEKHVGAHVSGEYPVFHVNQQVVNLDYLRHLLLWPTLWARLVPRGSMARRKRTNPAMLLSTEVPLPHLSDQETIARRLSTVGETRELGDLQVGRLASLHASALNAAFDHHS